MDQIEYLPESEIRNARRSNAPGAKRADGYGNKIPTSWELQLTDKRWRRVYVVCWSNSGSAYVLVRGRPQYLLSSFDAASYVRQ